MQKTVKLINHYSKDSQRKKMLFRALVLYYVTLEISVTDKVRCETYFLMDKCETHDINFPEKDL